MEKLYKLKLMHINDKLNLYSFMLTQKIYNISFIKAVCSVKYDLLELNIIYRRKHTSNRHHSILDEF